MTTMSIDNNPLSQGSLQFIGISDNKLKFKSINILNIQKVAALFEALSAGTETYFILKSILVINSKQ